METEIDIKLGKMKQREKEVSKVVDRYIRMRLKRNVRKLFGLRLK
jgi:predicted CopG family antitoxin